MGGMAAAFVRQQRGKGEEGQTQADNVKKGALGCDYWGGRGGKQTRKGGGKGKKTRLEKCGHIE